MSIEAHIAKMKEVKRQYFKTKSEYRRNDLAREYNRLKTELNIYNYYQKEARKTK